MGLDISTYENLQFALPGEGMDEDGDIDDSNGYFKLHVNQDFLARAAGIPDGAICSGYEKTHSFRAGSYSGYGEWRNMLAELAQYPLAPEEYGSRAGRSTHQAGAWQTDEGPFWELINFSDCEGCIGPQISEKLAANFEQWHDKAKVFFESKGDSYHWRKYEDFALAFKMAANNGAVSFH